MYSIYYPCQNYGQILDELAATKTNSAKTSSLPLADFWRPERNEVIIKLFQRLKIGEIDIKTANYCFEYPTPAYENRKTGKKLTYSKSSMTDLMILFGEKTRITIEAKYTEYDKDTKYTPLLEEWYKKDYINGAPHRKEIIKCWLDYINMQCKCVESDVETFINENQDLPYQLLHRTASACFNCKHPILVYQLFYDKEKKEKLEVFEQLLNKWVKKLGLKKETLPFYIIECEVIGCPAKGKNGAKQIFLEMKEKQQYEFNDDALKVLDGYSLGSI